MVGGTEDGRPVAVGYGEAQAGVVAVADGDAVGVAVLGVEPVDEFFGLRPGGVLDRHGAAGGGEACGELFAGQAPGQLDVVAEPGDVRVGNPCDPAGTHCVSPFSGVARPGGGPVAGPGPHVRCASVSCYRMSHLMVGFVASHLSKPGVLTKYAS